MTMESVGGATSAVGSPAAVDVAGRERAFAGTSYFGSLDGVRAVAVIGVLWHHTVAPNDSIPLSGRGFLGVDMFFVLSGFLITTILLREQQAHDDISLKRFYARRSLRIFPLYYAVVLGSLALALFSDSPQLTAIEDSAPQLLLYLTNWFPTISLLAVSWSLATEEQFYLVWPPLQKFLGAAALIPLGLFVAANQLVNFGYLFSAQREELEILQVTFTPIILGVVLAYLLHHRYGVVWQVVGHRLAAPALAAGLLVLMALPNEVTSLVGVHRLAIHLAMTALLAALVVREDHPLAGALKQRPLVRIGAISYGIYLLHMFVRHVVVEMLGLDFSSVPLGLFVVVGIGTVIAAEISFRLFESPLLRLKPTGR
ncbi:MAG: acyltransferase [Actinomycetota bacterium]